MRKNIWEINEMFLCPVTGFCLSQADHQSILKKCVPKSKRKFASGRLHNFMMENISLKTSIAKYVQKLLDNKYSKEINRCWDIDNDKWMKEINKFLNWEDFGAFIWISAIYKNLEERDVEKIMSKIHMYTHQIYFQLQNAETELININEQSKLITEKYRNIRIKQKEAAKELLVLKISNNQLIIDQQNRLSIDFDLPIKNHQNDNSFVKTVIILEQQLKDKEKAIVALKTENKQLTKKASSQSSLYIEMKNDFDKILDNLKAQNEKCNACDKVDLCQRRVLLVGGITKMESFYRKLIQELGGRFYYHDGYCRQNESTLNNLITQSDIVICPVDVNSHAACLQVKKACKKSGTNFYMLRKSSISTVYNTLREAASA